MAATSSKSRFLLLPVGSLLLLTSLLRTQQPLFQRPPPPIPRVEIWGGALRDIVGSSAPDLICPQSLSVLQNDGDGRFFSTAATTPVFPQQVGSGSIIDCGDVDGDGDLDLMMKCFDGVHLLLWSGTAFLDATTQTPTYWSPLWAYTSLSGALADFDQDGDLDFIHAGFVQSSISGFGATTPTYWRNVGAGIYVDQSSLLPAVTPGAYLSGDAINDLLARDFDRDGDIDVLLIRRHAYGLAFGILWLNDGAGGFPTTLPVGTSGLYPGRAVCGDIDGDGLPDLLAWGGSLPSSVNGAQQGVWLNAGGGTFTHSFVPPLPGAASSQAEYRLADLDRDGRCELLAFSANDSRITLHRLPNGICAPAHQTLVTGNYVSSVLLGDSDDDGDVDLIASTQVGSTLHYVNDGSGQLMLDGPPAANLVWNHPQTFTDHDGDGMLDVVMQDNLGLGVALNRGAETFQDAGGRFGPAFGVGWTGTLVPLDFDGDGDQDFFLPGSAAAPDRFYRQLSPASYALAQQNAAPDGFMGAEVLDLHPNGQKGIVVRRVISASQGTSRLDLWSANGSGGMSLSANLAPQFVAISSPAVADFDGNGYSDLAVVGSMTTVGWGAFQLYFLLSNGNGQFALGPQALVADGGLRAADLDGDGISDLVIGNRVYRNLGGAYFTFVQTLPGPTAAQPSIAGIADFDADGSNDLLFSNLGLLSGVWGYALNFGNGMFSPIIPIQDASPAGLPFLGDLDGDGDVDVVFGVGSSLLNTTRQLESQRLVRPGRPFSIEAFGAGGTGFSLFLATSAARLAMEPYGTLFLDPLSLTPVTSLLLPVTGRATLSFQLPASPSLEGQSFFLQAATGLPTRLTNASSMTIVN